MTLAGLFVAVPAFQTAIVLSEQNIRITYGNLRDQVQAVTDSLAAAGITRGDRVGMALPNGLPMIVCFLAASVAGTAAPLSPAYKEEEFRVYLDDTNARVLLLSPEGADEARRAAGDRWPVLTVTMDAEGTVTLSGSLHQLLLARAEPGAAKPAGAEKLRFIRSCSASLAPQVMSTAPLPSGV